MLENRRYWLAQRAMLNLALFPQHGLPTQETFEELLQVQFMTQITLEKMKIKRKFVPANVPRINELFVPSKPSDRSKPAAIHVIGMPKTLKSTVMDALAQIGTFVVNGQSVALRTEEEQAGIIKLLHDKRNSRFNYAEYIISQAMINIVLATWNQRQMESSRTQQLYLQNRGPFDLSPFTEANFLFGRLDIRKYSSAIFNIRSNVGAYSGYRNAVLLLLVSPELALERHAESGDNGYGRAMNPQFLPILYEQYLRFHSSMLDSDRMIPGLQEQVPYACVDMSGNLKQALGRYVQAFAGCLDYFFG